MVMDSSFDTLQEALDSDRVNKGWIPGWVPQAATDLREVHDLDSNTSALAFTKPAAIPLQLPADCQATTFNNSDPVAFNRYWWPGNGTLSASYRVSLRARIRKIRLRRHQQDRRPRALLANLRALMRQRHLFLPRTP